jgi:CRISPR-associated protein Cas1
MGINKTIYVFSDGEIKRKENTIFFEKENGEKKFIPIETTKEILLFGEVSFNKRCLEFFSKNEILLHLFNHYGYYIGSFYPREHNCSGETILKQAEFYLDKEKRLFISKKITKGGLNNIIKCMLYYQYRKVDLTAQIETVKTYINSIEQATEQEYLLGLEGNSREVYYSSFDRIINSENFSFEVRTRMPPRNRLNALISFGNSCLYTTVLSEIYKTHLDPRIGYVHATNQRRFSLNLDIADIFKPIIVDRTIFSLLNKNILRTKHFAEEELGGIYLTEEGCKIFTQEYENKLSSSFFHKNLNKYVSYRHLIRLELYKIEKHIIEDQEYEPFVAQW